MALDEALRKLETIDSEMAKLAQLLVTMHDDRAVPKVIDFGVAKATSQRLPEQTICTQFSQMVGTPLYMSPSRRQDWLRSVPPMYS